jgi:hypothetical protein
METLMEVADGSTRLASTRFEKIGDAWITGE